MPLCIWAAQTSVVALDASVETGTPHTATIEIQRVCQPHVVDRIFNDSESDDNATPSVMLADSFEHVRRAIDLFTFSQRKFIGACAFSQRKRIGHYLAEDHGSSHLDNG
jgi:hypothetical protein